MRRIADNIEPRRYEVFAQAVVKRHARSRRPRPPGLQPHAIVMRAFSLFVEDLKRLRSPDLSAADPGGADHPLFEALEHAQDVGLVKTLFTLP